MTKVVISQPAFFPWPGFYDLVNQADIFIWLDDAQFSKGWYTNRTKLFNNGKQSWLTIPVTSKSHFNKISNIESSADFKSNHINKLKSSFSNLCHLDLSLEVYAEAFYANSSLCDSIKKSVELILKYLNSSVEIHSSTDLGLNSQSSERVLDICQHFNASMYITGHGAINYLNHDLFEENNIMVNYINYDVASWRDVPVYSSILDLIATNGTSNLPDYLNSSLIDWRLFRL